MERYTGLELYQHKRLSQYNEIENTQFSQKIRRQGHFTAKNGIQISQDNLKLASKAFNNIMVSFDQQYQNLKLLLLNDKRVSKSYKFEVEELINDCLSSNLKYENYPFLNHPNYSKLLSSLKFSYDELEKIKLESTKIELSYLHLQKVSELWFYEFEVADITLSQKSVLKQEEGKLQNPMIESLEYLESFNKYVNYTKKIYFKTSTENAIAIGDSEIKARKYSRFASKNSKSKPLEADNFLFYTNDQHSSCINLIETHLGLLEIVSIKGMNANDFKSDWPPPPFFYTEYSDGETSGRSPPRPPLEYWSLFGNRYSEHAKIEPLSSDTILYNENEETDLKEEFRRLYYSYVEQIDIVIESLANNRGNESDQIKKLMKIYQNLLYILLKLRRPQTEQFVLERLNKQLEERMKQINTLEEQLHELSPEKQGKFFRHKDLSTNINTLNRPT